MNSPVEESTEIRRSQPNSNLKLRRLSGMLDRHQWLGAPVWLVALSMVLAWAATCLMGKDVNADFINYHLYSAHALVTGQFRTDFMGAGPQSYLNPLGYVPLYLLLKADLPAPLIGMLYASIHALNLILLWHICRDYLFPSNEQRNLLSLSGALLGAISPVFIAMIGGTFLDPVTSILMLGALLLLLRAGAYSEQHYWQLGGAGLLLGAATALKLVGAIYCVAAALTILFLPGGWRIKPRQLGAIVLGGVTGFALFGGWWAWEMWREFGNPFFPVFNGWFKSPDYHAENVVHDRFVLHNMSEILTLPVRMMKMNSGIYVEILAPDIRLFLVLASLMLIASIAVAKRVANQPSRRTLTRSEWICLTFFVVGWILNHLTSGNGRYATTSLLLAGPVLALLVLKLSGTARRALVLIGLVLLAQFAHAYKAGYPRWDAAPWTRHWIDHSVPLRLQRESFGYLSLSTFNQSLIMPYLAPGSGVVNLHGFEPLSPAGPGADRVRDFMQRYQGRLRMLLRSDEVAGSETTRSGEIGPVLRITADRLLEPWGLHVVRDRCEYLEISMHGSLSEDSGSAGAGYRYGYLVVSCELAKGASAEAGLAEERERLTPVFDSITESCPLLFPRPGGHPYKYGTAWVKRYAATDTILAVIEDKVIYSKYPFGPFNVNLGSVQDWTSAKATLDCRRTPRPW